MKIRFWIEVTFLRSVLHLSVVMSLIMAMVPGMGLMGAKSTPTIKEDIGMCSLATCKRKRTKFKNVHTISALKLNLLASMIPAPRTNRCKLWIFGGIRIFCSTGPIWRRLWIYNRSPWPTNMPCLASVFLLSPFYPFWRQVLSIINFNIFKS